MLLKVKFPFILEFTMSLRNLTYPNPHRHFLFFFLLILLYGEK